MRAIVAEQKPEQRSLLLSVRPRFADAILDGTKRVELRRTRIGATDGTLVILYATAPTMAVIGVATLAGRETNTPTEIWRKHHRDLGLSRTEFDSYLDGASHPTALTLEHAHRLDTAYPLATLRRANGFCPPQSYRFVSPADPAPIRELADKWLAKLGS